MDRRGEYMLPVNASTLQPVTGQQGKQAPGQRGVDPGGGSITQSFVTAPRHALGTVRTNATKGNAAQWYKCAPLFDPRKPPHGDETSYDGKKYVAMESESTFTCQPKDSGQFAGAARALDGHLYINQVLTMIMDCYNPMSSKKWRSVMTFHEDFLLGSNGAMKGVDPHLAAAPWPEICRIDVKVSSVLTLRYISRRDGKPVGKDFLFYGNTEFALPSNPSAPPVVPKAFLQNAAESEKDYRIVDYGNFTGGYTYPYQIIHCLSAMFGVIIPVNDPPSPPPDDGGTPTPPDTGGRTPTPPDDGVAPAPPPLG